ncbi:uncharacterized protein LOC132279446 [Cornus florida]|uniref:uncharacterized protein LOC132279446 n=1 Tax=Cornus florida TaxID=4283 RepID=UPI00289C10B3|nr:uncharacterized protein LOC132279446 [Cornus florida]
MQMENEFNSNKLHYDIAMSKRTRKPLKLGEEANNEVEEGPHLETESPSKCVNECVEGEENDHTSLKQLIEGRSSLIQHFTEEEKQLQMVVKHQEEGLDGMKFKKMVKSYAKVLSHLIKVKRDPPLGSRKRLVRRLTM